MVAWRDGCRTAGRSRCRVVAVEKPVREDQVSRIGGENERVQAHLACAMSFPPRTTLGLFLTYVSVHLLGSKRSARSKREAKAEETHVMLFLEHSVQAPPAISALSHLTRLRRHESHALCAFDECQHSQSERAGRQSSAESKRGGCESEQDAHELLALFLGVAVLVNLVPYVPPLALRPLPARARAGLAVVLFRLIAIFGAALVRLSGQGRGSSVGAIVSAVLVPAVVLWRAVQPRRWHGLPRFDRPSRRSEALVAPFAVGVQPSRVRVRSCASAA